MSLTHWTTVVAAVKAGATHGKFAFLGDSITAGYGASGNANNSARANSYPSWLAGFLSRMGLPCETDSFFGEAHVTPTIGYPTYDPRVSLSGGWAYYANQPNSLGGWMFSSGNTSGALSFTPVNQVDRIELFHRNNAHLSVNVDGGSALATTTPGTDGTTKTTINCTLGTHTINVVNVGPEQPFVIGMHAYNSAVKRVAVMNMGMGGAKAADWADSSQSWSPIQSLGVLSADLAVICLGANDWPTGVHTSPLTFIDKMQAVIDAVVNAGGDIVLLTPPPGHTSSMSTVARQNELQCAAKALACKNDCPLIDLTARWGSYAQSVDRYSDGQHPNYEGYVDIGYAIAEAVK